MAWMPPHAFAALAVALLLAGCSSSPPSVPTGAQPSAADTPPAPAPDLPSAPAPTQSEDLAWTASALACPYAGAPDPRFKDAYRTELEGLLYDAVPVLPATRGQSYNATFGFQAAAAMGVLVFWNGTVGPDGLVAGSKVAGLGPLAGPLSVKGEVPLDADFVSAAGCGGGGGSARYASGPAA